MPSKGFVATGVLYADQVILARSHLTLARITGVLEQLGVPLLYLGDLFERDGNPRPSLAGRARCRVWRRRPRPCGRSAGISGAAGRRSGRSSLERETQRVTIFEALSARLRKIDGSQQRRPCRASPALGSQLDGLSKASPWTLLTTWLFERSDYLRPILTGNDAAARQQLVAIYQLLKVCGEYAAMGDTSRKRFLERIRRIEALNEDTAYRAVSSEAAIIDAVRVMTIHGSKGLEFRAVHLPALATRYMPSNRQACACPPPPSLPHLAMQHPASRGRGGMSFLCRALARAEITSRSAARNGTRRETPAFPNFCGRRSAAFGADPAIEGSGRLVHERKSD